MKAFKDDGLKTISADDFKRLLIKVRRFSCYGYYLNAWAERVEGQRYDRDSCFWISSGGRLVEFFGRYL